LGKRDAESSPGQDAEAHSERDGPVPVAEPVGAVREKALAKAHVDGWSALFGGLSPSMGARIAIGAVCMNCVRFPGIGATYDRVRPKVVYWH
jgi:hypothetical protein